MVAVLPLDAEHYLFVSRLSVADGASFKETVMSTRCLIGYVDGDCVRYTYCHHDGYVQHVGRILLDHYKTVEDVRKLVLLGDLSSLGLTPEGVSAGDAEDTPGRVGYARVKCVADHGADGIPAEDVKYVCGNGSELSAMRQFAGLRDLYIEHVYLFWHGVWLTDGYDVTDTVKRALWRSRSGSVADYELEWFGRIVHDILACDPGNGTWFVDPWMFEEGMYGFKDWCQFYLDLDYLEERFGCEAVRGVVDHVTSFNPREPRRVLNKDDALATFYGGFLDFFEGYALPENEDDLEA